MPFVHPAMGEHKYKTPQTNTAMPMRRVQTNNATVDKMFWWPKVRLIALGTQIHTDNNDISSSLGTCGLGHTPSSTRAAHGSCLVLFRVAPNPPFVSRALVVALSDTLSAEV